MSFFCGRPCLPCAHRRTAAPAPRTRPRRPARLCIVALLSPALKQREGLMRQGWKGQRMVEGWCWWCFRGRIWQNDIMAQWHWCGRGLHPHVVVLLIFRERSITNQMTWWEIGAVDGAAGASWKTWRCIWLRLPWRLVWAAASLEALGHEFGVRGVDLKEVSAGPMMFLAVVASINSASKPHCFEHLVLGWSCKGSPYVDSQVIPRVLRVCRHVHGLIVSTETYAIYTHPKHP